MDLAPRLRVHRVPHLLAQTYALCGLPRGVERNGVLGPKQHHGGAQQEASHFIALLQAQRRVVVGPLAHLAGARWIHHAMPGRGHAAHDGGTDEHQHVLLRRLPCRSGHVKHTHHAFVAGKQTGHATGCGGVDREQIAGHMNHAAQAAAAGHVDAVVVLGTEVDGGELAILELGGQRGIATHQRLRAVAVAFGLKHLVTRNATELADRTIHRAHKRGIGQGACTGL